MRQTEKGYSLVELLISITIFALAAGVAGMAIFQILGRTQNNSDRMTLVRQVQNAGAWISRDAQMAASINSTANLTLPNFLVINWTEWDTSGNPISHSSRYFFENMANNVGTLKRLHQSSLGTSEEMTVAQYIYFNSTDTANTSNASFQTPLLTVRVTALLDSGTETREYRITRRPNM